MKKLWTKICLVFTSTIISSALVFGFGCNCNKTPSKLTTPVVTLEGNTASWQADENAVKFEISLNGVLSYLESSVNNVVLQDGQSFKVKAIGDGNEYLDSEWSNTVTYTIPTPPTPSVPETYTVIWKNGDEILETDFDVEYGSMPSYDGQTPLKENTQQYTYTFKGWSPALSPVTASITYEAQFNQTVNRYTVTFYNELGNTVLDTVVVNYGESAVFSQTVPVKSATEGYTYVFEKWVTSIGGAVKDDLSNVVSDRSVYASFKALVRRVSVYVVSNNTDYGSVSVSVLNNVPYGSAISLSGNAVTIDGQTVTATAKQNTLQYSYSFVNWTSDATVDNDTIITANFVRNINKYTVTWKNGNQIIELDENVNYGEMPRYDGAVPTMSGQVGHTYTFSGWSPSVTTVIGDVTYEAQFVDSLNNYVVTFYDENGTTLLGAYAVKYGETAVYPNATPSKQSTESKEYTFDKWVTQVNGSEQASLENIQANINVYAHYLESARKYKATYLDVDGEKVGEEFVVYGSNGVFEDVPEVGTEDITYRFDGWEDTATKVKYENMITNVRSDITVKATFVQTFEVRFLDYDGSLIDAQVVDMGKNAVAPSRDVGSREYRVGYQFNGWKESFDNVQQNVTVTASYTKVHTVKFLGINGQVLCEEDVLNGQRLITSISEIEVATTDYDFTGWDTEINALTVITEDMTINAIYKEKTFSVTFIMPDGREIIKKEEVKIGSNVQAPTFSDDINNCDYYFPSYYFDFNKNKMVVFSGWEGEFSNITENTVITAKYENEYDKPVLYAVSKDDGIKTTISIRLYIPSNCYVYSFDYGFTWDGSMNISDYENKIVDNTNLTGYGQEHECTIKQEIKYDNKNREFSDIWLCQNGGGHKQTTNYIEIIEITFTRSSGATFEQCGLVFKNCKFLYANSDNVSIDELTVINSKVEVKVGE